jgi:putative nucleotidyltransferase with HDIG domain
LFGISCADKQEMLPPARLAKYGRAYISVVILLGFCVIGRSVYELYLNPLGYQWFLLAALTLLSGSATVKLPSVPASISISEAFVFTAILLYGPSAGTLTVALDGLAISYWIAKRRPEPHRALFNMAAPAVSAWCAAVIFFHLAGIPPLAQGKSTTLNSILPSLFVSALTYFTLNSWLITFAISAETQLPPLSVWRENFIWLSLNYFCGASVAALLVVHRPEVSLPYIAAIAPLLLVLYFTFKTSMDRVEDANKHVAKVNSLYLSTIETLAMAIDAKDQITHGHIRRVQKYTIALAREVGVSDESLIRAIEAAALLHDMGKLAIPEHILNKPGKLTGIEFDKMKVHATVGADILSAIDFPYPVVPIVRHHHENWDGTGYPAGLKGTDIPIGARILSVVDCFDALTSDRPYRPRLPIDDALRILTDRRGSMYDPLVVDTFIRVHSGISADPPTTRLDRSALNEIASSRQVSSPKSTVCTSTIALAADREELLTVCELARIMGSQVIPCAGDVISNHLRPLVPFSQSILFLYDVASSELVARHLVGDCGSVIHGLRIPLGQKLSGWVGANRQTIVNSDPALDFGDDARALRPQPHYCLSTPLLFRDQLIGVLTLYSAVVDGFSSEHQRLVEDVAKQVSGPLEQVAARDHSARANSLGPWATLPDLCELEQLAEATGANRFSVAPRATLLLVEMTNLEHINQQHGRTSGADACRQVLSAVRLQARASDSLFRRGSGALVVVMDDADVSAAETLGRRISSSVRSGSWGSINAGAIDISCFVHTVKSPGGGTPLAELRMVIEARLATEPHVAAYTRVH